MTEQDPGTRPYADSARMRFLRIGDAERDAAVAALQEHHVAGRLDRSEFEARMEAALAARTRGDLEPLFADLPAPGMAVARPVVNAERSPRPSARALVPVLVSSIWPLTILACLLLHNWSLIAVPFLLVVITGGPRRRYRGRRWVDPRWGDPRRDDRRWDDRRWVDRRSDHWW